MHHTNVGKAHALMQRYHDYAKSIGCVTYDDGALCDSIECTTEQAAKLAAWWDRETRNGIR